jgi:hypothetical protein
VAWRPDRGKSVRAVDRVCVSGQQLAAEQRRTVHLAPRWKHDDMTPEQHATRAEELAAEAEQLYGDLRLDVETAGNVDPTIWGFLDTTIRLGQLHAALARQYSAAASAEISGTGGAEGQHKPR